MKICSTCDGEGHIVFDLEVDDDGELCPSCNGLGVVNVPRRIYLQVFGPDGNDPDGPYDGEITWCVDRINDSDIEYILNDGLVRDD